MNGERWAGGGGGEGQVTTLVCSGVLWSVLGLDQFLIVLFFVLVLSWSGLDMAWSGFGPILVFSWFGLNLILVSLLTMTNRKF